MHCSNISFSQFNTENKSRVISLLKNPCENIGILLSHLTSSENAKTKSLIVDHVFSCDKCYNSFRDFVILSDSINAFSEDIHRYRNLLYKGMVSQPKSISWLAWAKLTFISIVLIVAFSTLIFTINRKSHLNGTDADSAWRGLSLNNYFEIFPFPYSIISRDSLRFTKSNNSDIREWQIFILDADLDVILNSDRVKNYTFVPDKNVIDSFKRGSVYYWKYIENGEGGLFRESNLIPFFIRD